MADLNAPWHELEKRALVGNRDAVIRLVSGFRKYRDAWTRLDNARYADGAVDGVTTTNLIDELAEVDAEASDNDA